MKCGGNTSGSRVLSCLATMLIAVACGSSDGKPPPGGTGGSTGSSGGGTTTSTGPGAGGTDGGAAPTIQPRTETYEYDPSGRLIGVIYGDGTAVSYTYDDAGNLLRRTIEAP